MEITDFWEVILEEQIADNLMQTTYRAKVVGGWIIRHEVLLDTREGDLDGWSNSNNSMIFLADVHHIWD